jgi:hypothetical protein
MTPTDRNADMTNRIPETVWPDGTQVSAWSKATGTMPGNRAPENYRPPVIVRGRGDR